MLELSLDLEGMSPVDELNSSGFLPIAIRVLLRKLRIRRWFHQKAEKRRVMLSLSPPKPLQPQEGPYQDPKTALPPCGAASWAKHTSHIA